MKRTFTKFVWLILIVFPALVFAQTAPGRKVWLRGSFVDEQQKPVPFATLAVYGPGNALVTGAVADDAGTFAVQVPPGRYELKLTAVSYRERTLPGVEVGKQDVQLGPLALTADSQRLDEVVVRGERSQMVLALDKKVFNVGKDLANAGGTALNILGNVPSVAVDVEGNVSLRGSSNVRILIDGKPSGLVSFKGGSGLQQLQASMIERVEIITNPSARYEAEGMSGIINIVLKKDQQQGLNGSFDVIAGHPTNYGLAANVNYRRKNLNFFVNYTASYRNTPGRNSLYQEVYRGDSTFASRQSMTSRLNGMNNSARAGLDYFFNPKNILTAAYTWRTSKGKRFSDIEYLDYLPNSARLSAVTKRTQDETETEPNAEYALTYKRSFAREGHTFTADLRVLDNWEKSSQFYTQATRTPDGKPTGARDILQRSPNDETEKQFLVQIDYVRPFAKDGKAEAGVRSSTRRMTNDFTVEEQTAEGGWVPLPGLTNTFLYDEIIHAAYGILGNKSGKLSYQAGVRAEYTDLNTTLRQTGQVNPRSYANLFPSVHVSYELPRQHALQLSYSRRVRRPQYNDLSPYMTFSDARNFFSGNPDLNPEFTNAFEIGHLKTVGKGSFTSSLYYRHTTGKIIRIRRVDAAGNSNTRPENLATEDSYGAEFTGTFTPRPWWKLDGSLNFFRATTNGANLDATFQADTYSWFARSLSRFTIRKTTDFQLRANYEAPQQTPQGLRRAIATLDLALSRDILKNNGTLTLNVIDVFNSRVFRAVTEGAGFYTESSSQGRLRQINLTLNYRLRQAKKKAKEGGEGEF
jgi:outer membrane receptor protein involved in Fe transport